jgi:hypothetical protein
MKKTLIIVWASIYSLGLSTFAMDIPTPLYPQGKIWFWAKPEVNIYHVLNTGTIIKKEFKENKLEQENHSFPSIWEKIQIVNEAISTAIKANDYNAFIKGFTEQLTSIKTPTQEEFNILVAKPIDKPETVSPMQEAIKTNNYTAFVKAFNDNKYKSLNAKGDYTPSQTEFAKFVDMYVKHEAIKSAIKANDYNAFVKAFEANKPTVPTKEEFAKMVILQQSIKENKTEIKTIKNEVKAETITKVEAKEKISSIKNENVTTKKAIRLAKKPLRKVF